MGVKLPAHLYCASPARGLPARHRGACKNTGVPSQRGRHLSPLCHSLAEGSRGRARPQGGSAERRRVLVLKTAAIPRQRRGSRTQVPPRLRGARGPRTSELLRCTVGGARRCLSVELLGSRHPPRLGRADPEESEAPSHSSAAWRRRAAASSASSTWTGP